MKKYSGRRNEILKRGSLFTDLTNEFKSNLDKSEILTMENVSKYIGKEVAIFSEGYDGQDNVDVFTLELEGNNIKAKEEGRDPFVWVLPHYSVEFFCGDLDRVVNIMKI